MSRARAQLAPLYERLPHGPSGMRPEEVARHQRARIYGAMIESVSRRGYEDTTVADVIALAGVSRRAFYEQFSNKEDCFLSTHDILVARARKHVIRAWRTERGWGTSLHAACGALLTEIAEAPKGPRLVLVESLAVGRPARERIRLAGVAFERLVACVLAEAPNGGRPAPLAPRAIVGGVRQLAFRRLMEGRERELPDLTEELLDWIDSYRHPAGTRVPVPFLGQRGPRRQVVPRFLDEGGERARAMRALAQLSLAHGYGTLSEPQIAQVAGIATDDFQTLFGSREGCLLAILEELAGELLSDLAATRELAGSWPEAVRDGVRALVDYLLAREELLRIAFVVALEAGPAAVGRITSTLVDVVTRLCEGGPEPRRGGKVTPEALGGALWAVVAACCLGGRPERLSALLDHLSFLVLAPYLGGRAAVAAIRKP